MIVLWIILLVISGFLSFSGGTGFGGVIASIVKTVAWIGIFSYFGILGNWFVIVLIALNIIGVLVKVARSINDY